MKTTSVPTMVMTMTFQMTRLMTLLTICSHTNSLCLIISLGCNVVSTRDSTDWDASGLTWRIAVLYISISVHMVKYRWSPQKSKKQWQRPSNRGWPEIIGNLLCIPGFHHCDMCRVFTWDKEDIEPQICQVGGERGGWHSEMSKSLHRENLSNHILL